jgi:hypothetical protein
MWCRRLVTGNDFVTFWAASPAIARVMLHQRASAIHEYFGFDRIKQQLDVIKETIRTIVDYN